MKVVYLSSLISNHQEIQIDDIAIEGLTQADNLHKLQKKQKLMRIAKECASLPTLVNHSPNQILGYEQSDFGLWGNN